MRDIKVASRYANSLLKIAIQENSLEDLFADMQAIKQVCDGSRDLELVLKSPIIKSDKKQEILDAIFGKNLSKMSILFIALIIKKKRAGLISDIAAAFVSAYKNHKHISIAKVTSAIPLSKAQKENIVSLLNNTSINKEASLEIVEVVDQSIIGGLIVRVGDKQIDESIKRKLINLEMEFDENPYVKEF
jgi:F-type H+-transporting ATPase subunit delta